MLPKIHKTARQKGAALISALFISALAALLATHMAYRQNMLIHTMIQTSDQQQLLSDYHALQSWAVSDLINLTNKQKPVSGGISILPATTLNKSMDGWKFAVNIYDQQSHYNINLLTDQKNIVPFANWLRILQPNLPQNTALQLAQQISGWVSEKPDPNDSYYQQLNPGYRAAHHPMFDTSELNLLRAFNTSDPMMVSLKQQLLKYSAALPAGVQPNIWSVNPMVFPTMLDLTTKPGAVPPPVGTIVQQFTSCRKQAIASGDPRQGFNILQQCMQKVPGAGNLGSVANLSHYFLIKIRATRENAVKYYTSLVHVGFGQDQNKNKTVVANVLWQRYFVGAN